MAGWRSTRSGGMAEAASQTNPPSDWQLRWSSPDASVSSQTLDTSKLGIKKE